jgi:hypothetical protein
MDSFSTSVNDVHWSLIRHTNTHMVPNQVWESQPRHLLHSLPTSSSSFALPEFRISGRSFHRFLSFFCRERPTKILFKFIIIYHFCPSNFLPSDRIEIFKGNWNLCSKNHPSIGSSSQLRNPPINHWNLRSKKIVISDDANLERTTLHVQDGHAV